MEDEDDVRTIRFKELFLAFMWKRKRTVIQMICFTAAACLSTFWRLTFDCVNIVYLIHSIVIFTDLLLAAILTRSVIFNLSLNIIAISHAIWYKCTGRVVTELTETTAMAIVASIYSLMLKFRHRRQIESVSHHENQWYQMHMYLQDKLGTTPIEFIVEEFLDGAAGIMYTSFFGLVISEIAVINTASGNNYLYCIWSDHLLGCPKS